MVFTKMCRTSVLILLALGITHTSCQDQKYWYEAAKDHLQKQLEKKDNTGVAKNIVFMMGDGMGLPSVTAGRILAGQQQGLSGEEYQLQFEKFPDVALVKTYETDAMIPDSAGTATAMLCGVKTKYRMIGIDDTALSADCPSALTANVTSVLQWAVEAGKSVGLITTSRVTHASPAPLYAHAPTRKWESDVPEEYRGKCTDIAYQLVHGYPGTHIQVILGGGREVMLNSTVPDPVTPEEFGTRSDGRNLIEDWAEDKRRRNVSHRYVVNTGEFDDVDPEHTDYLLGLFEYGKLLPELDRDKSEKGHPSLSAMVDKAIKILSKNDKGFFLFVENGKIDNQHHISNVVRAINEVVNLNRAVQTAEDAIEALGETEETLLLVTADHSHGVVFAGKPKRGHPLFDKIYDDSKIKDDLPYTALVYGTGPGYNLDGTRYNLTSVNTTSKDYVSQSAVPRTKSAHSGEDVAAFARGPWSHLLAGTIEQPVLAHFMALSACIGHYSDHAHCVATESVGNDTGVPMASKQMDSGAAGYEPRYCLTGIIMLLVALTTRWIQPRVG